jgi:26S proteasome regulatory subunit N2
LHNNSKKKIDWVKKATLWAKFTTAASLGVIHKGNHANAMKLFKEYLPGENNVTNAYTNGGSLFGNILN